MTYTLPHNQTQASRTFQNEQSLVNNLAEAICDSSFLSTKTEKEYTTIHGIDIDIYKPTAQHLFVSLSGGQDVRIANNSIHLNRDNCLTTGTLRNSLYLEPWKELTKVHGLYLRLKFRGVIRIRVYQVVFGVMPELINSQWLDHPEMETTRIKLPTLQDYPKNCRLFWDIVCEGERAEIESVSYETNTATTNDGRLVVLLRTFGRTKDILRLLKQFDEDAAKSEYRDLFERLYFVVLDTSSDIDRFYQETTWHNINVAAIKSANLGGGGNASHMLYLIRSAFEKLNAEPDDLLILDDDLDISSETLRRYASFCRYRTQAVICSLPVFMKSQPIVLWEDGGYWGRLNPNEEMCLERQSLFPTLLRHGWRFKGFDHLDELATLNYCEYSTFIFYGVPYKVFLQLGYPTAFFLRGDDIEYSLRANAAGIKLFTNPNLCAWHEPAHSFVQEYMAILHGIMINLAYGGDKLDNYVDFFEKRVREHASVCDDIGLIVYTEILKTLVEDTPVLLLDFAQHYLEKFKFFKQFDRSYKWISPFLVQQMRHKMKDIPASSDPKAKAYGTLVVPFVHMGDQSHLRFKSVLLHNPHSEMYRHIDVADIKQRKLVIEQMSVYYGLLSKLIANFSDIADKWRQLMVNTQQEEFWLAITMQTREKNALLQTSSRGNKEQALPVGYPEADLPPEPIFQDADEEKIFLANTSLPDSLDSGLPEDFDIDAYLERNQDVAAAGVDPVQHYLMYGRFEGRTWR